MLPALDVLKGQLQAWKPQSLEDLHTQLTILMIISGAATFLALLFGPTAPYGRYSRSGWGFLINAKLAWLTQELPSLLLTAWFCHQAGWQSFASHPTSLRTACTALFLAHYTYRSLIFPFLLRGNNKTPFSIWLMSFIFCLWNGFLQGYCLAYQMPADGSITPRAMIGLCIQALGLLNVMWADTILIGLRKPGETGYKIPHGGMFRFVSAGNYASEIMEWAGYAIASATLPAAAFTFFAFCNLAPRGWQHHKWYQQKFEDYPSTRKAIIPFLW